MTPATMRLRQAILNLQKAQDRVDHLGDGAGYETVYQCDGLLRKAKEQVLQAAAVEPKESLR
jgi:hypothetical protein